MDVTSWPDLAIYAAPLYLALIAGEIAWARGRGAAAREAARKDLGTNLAMGVGHAISVLTLYSGVTALMLVVWDLRLFDLGLAWWSLVIAFIVNDFVYYWSHRFQHRIRWCWATHVVHHSSQGYNLSTAVRQPWFGVAAGTYLLGVPAVGLGIHPGLWAFASSVNLFYQFFIHTQVVKRLPAPFEAVLNTPSHHRVHHATNPGYLDTNYGGVLIVWDRLFGTFAAEKEAEPCRFGLVSNLLSQNPFHVAVHEYGAIADDVIFRPNLTWPQRWAYLLGPPGYSHDGSRKTTATLKDEARRALSEGRGASMSG